MADKFDRFTKRGRRVLTLAQDEAQRLKHNYIGTEHLLLALTLEEKGVARQVLIDLNVDLKQLRASIERAVGRGQRAMFGKLTLTPRTKRVIELAVDEARQLSHHYIGTEHLLLGLIREGEGAAVDAMKGQGINLDKVRAQTARIIGQNKNTSQVDHQLALFREIRRILYAEDPLEGWKRAFGRKRNRKPSELLVGAHQATLIKMLDQLTEEEQQVLRLRLGLLDGQTYTIEEAADELNISIQRIEGIETHAIGILNYYARQSREQTGSVSDETPPAIEITPETRDKLVNELYEIVAREERTRLARDLHDSIKQQIFSISVSAAAIEARWDNDPDGAKIALADVRQSAKAAMIEMNALLHQLRPDPLVDTGLIEAIREQCEALDLRTGAQVTTTFDDLPPSERFPVGSHEAIFRIVQEALGNIARHARAKLVNVRLTTDMTSKIFQLEITDDGQGFDTTQSLPGMGLTNMLERARILGATLHIESASGRGTSIRLALPLIEANE